MTREDRALLLRAWLSWSSGRPIDNQTCLEFLDHVVRPDPRFAGIHVFEVLDLVVNAEPERRTA
jgi:hypothetical protein